MPFDAYRFKTFYSEGQGSTTLDSFIKIEFSLSSTCTSLSFSMRSTTTSPLYTSSLFMYSTQPLTLSLLSVNTFRLLFLTMLTLTCRSSKFCLIFLWTESTFPILNSVSTSLHFPSIPLFHAFRHRLYPSFLCLLYCVFPCSSFSFVYFLFSCINSDVSLSIHGFLAALVSFRNTSSAAFSILCLILIRLSLILPTPLSPVLTSSSLTALLPTRKKVWLSGSTNSYSSKTTHVKSRVPTTWCGCTPF